MVNTINTGLMTADEPLIIALANERYDLEVDYSMGLEDYRGLMKYHGIICDDEICHTNLARKNQTDFRTQRTFALAYGNHLASRDDYEMLIRSKGFCLANHHEAMTFGIFYKQEKMRQSIIALDVLFENGFGQQQALTLSYDYEVGAVNIGLKTMRLKVGPKYAHLIVLNEAITPIL